MSAENRLIRTQDLAIYYIHQEQTLKYEQLSMLLNQQHEIITQDLSNSYKILKNTIKTIKGFLEKNNFSFLLGKNSKGNFIEFSFEAFTTMNAQIPKEMKIIYLANSQEFNQYNVRIFEDCIKPLPQHVIQDYLAWVSKK